MDFLDELNENQRRAVEYTDGASLVIAGAGSGENPCAYLQDSLSAQKGISTFEHSCAYIYK